MRDIDFGKINIKLKDIMEKQNISINKLPFRSETQRSQICEYMNNTFQRLDTVVLTRLCYALECELSNLIEYILSPYSSQSAACHLDNIIYLPREPKGETSAARLFIKGLVIWSHIMSYSPL